MSNETALIVRNNNTALATAADVPDYLLGDDLAMSGAGLENISAKDMVIPRLALAQKGHAEVEDGNPKRIEGLAPGMFFNTVTKEIYGRGPLRFTVLTMEQSRRMFTSIETGSKTLCFSENGLNGGRIANNCLNCKHSKFKWNQEKGKNEKPDCTHFYNYVLLLYIDDNHFVPITLSLKSTQIEAAKFLNSMMKGRGRVAAFTGIYVMESFLETKKTPSYQAFKFDNAGWVPPELIENVKTMYKELESKFEDAIKYAESDSVLETEVVDDEIPF